MLRVVRHAGFGTAEPRRRCAGGPPQWDSPTRAARGVSVGRGIPTASGPTGPMRGSIPIAGIGHVPQHGLIAGLRRTVRHESRKRQACRQAFHGRVRTDTLHAGQTVVTHDGDTTQDQGFQVLHGHDTPPANVKKRAIEPARRARWFTGKTKLAVSTPQAPGDFPLTRGHRPASSTGLQESIRRSDQRFSAFCRGWSEKKRTGGPLIEETGQRRKGSR
jgi:hypothetical protein